MRHLRSWHLALIHPLCDDPINAVVSQSPELQKRTPLTLVIRYLLFESDLSYDEGECLNTGKLDYWWSTTADASSEDYIGTYTSGQLSESGWSGLKIGIHRIEKL